MKPYLFFVLFLVVLPWHGQTQQSLSEDDLIESLDNLNLLDQGNATHINLKNGVGNKIEVEQFNRQLANINQEGDFNEIYLSMKGDQNSISVNQIGDRHLVDINFEGKTNILGISQTGHGNKLFLDYFDVREINANFIQNGSNIEVEHRAIGLEALNYTIEFRGSNMNIKVVDLNNFLNY